MSGLDGIHAFVDVESAGVAPAKPIAKTRRIIMPMPPLSRTHFQLNIRVMHPSSLFASMVAAPRYFAPRSGGTVEHGAKSPLGIVRCLFLAGAMAGLLGVNVPCTAGIVLDQQNLQGPGGSSFGFGGGFYLGEQEIVAGVAGTLAGFDFICNGIGIAPSRQIDVSVKLGNVATGSILFQNTIAYASANVGSFLYVDTSAVQIPLAVGSRFTLGIYPRGGIDLAISTNNAYPAGAFFFESALQSNSDMIFRTYVSASPVPECDPGFFGSAAALLIGSLALVERRAWGRISGK